MIINDKIVYFQLHKTGCSHTKKIFTSIPEYNNIVIGNHNTYDSVDKKYLKGFESKNRIGNIRNPWDWYVSLWAYGCMGKGLIYRRLATNPDFFSINGLRTILVRVLRNEVIFSDVEKWLKLYSDPYKAENFRSWLKLILSDNNISIGEGYKESISSEFLGLLSYRYLKLYTYNGSKIVPNLKNYKDAVKHDENNNFINLMLRAESLDDDLINNFSLLGLNKNVLADVLGSFQEKTNNSERGNYRNYYDQETISLVEEKDALIISKYNYKF